MIGAPTFADHTRRNHGEMSRRLDCQELMCPQGKRKTCMDAGCDFFCDHIPAIPGFCSLDRLRDFLGPTQPIGQCEHGSPLEDGRIACHRMAGGCEFMQFPARSRSTICGLETAALEAVEQYQRELPPAMPEGGTDVMR